MLVPGAGMHLVLLFVRYLNKTPYLQKYAPGALSIQKLYVNLQSIRITGNAEERPVNVNAALRQGRRRGSFLIVAFLFIIIRWSMQFNLTYCQLFERITKQSSY